MSLSESTICPEFLIIFNFLIVYFCLFFVDFLGLNFVVLGGKVFCVMRLSLRLSLVIKGLNNWSMVPARVVD